MRIVNYAVNGAGVGHLCRLVALSRWMRRYGPLCGVRPEIYFLTSSEADTLLFHERFASFKVPSKTSVSESGIDKLSYHALARQWLWHSVSLLRPDLFIVDTFPRGAFNELLPVLDLCKRRAFIYRPTKPEFAARPEFQNMLELFDLILVPEVREHANVVIPPGLEPRVVYSGPPVMREAWELSTRSEARRAFDIPLDAPAVFLTAGGGGDPVAETRLHTVCDTLLQRDDLYVVVGAGPLYRGAVRFGPRLRWVSSWSMGEQLRAFDIAVCAAGFNTVHELLLAEVPAVFLPQDKIADEQDRRAARIAESGAGEVVTDGDVLGAVNRLLEADRRQAAQAACRLIMPANRARRMAAECLRLLAPDHAVDAAEDALTDAVLLTLEPARLGTDVLADVMRSLQGDRPARRLGAVVDLATGLLAHFRQLDIDIDTGLRIVSTLSRKLERTAVRERTVAIRHLLDALAPFKQWSAAMTLLRLMVPEKEHTATEVSAAMSEFLQSLHGQGSDLYRAVTLLSEAVGQQRSAGSNRELIQQVRSHA